LGTLFIGFKEKTTKMGCETRYWMLLAILMAVLGTFFNTIVFFSGGTDTSTVENVNWSYGKDGDNYFYTGVQIFVADISGGSTTSTKWTDSSCSDNFCDHCHTALGGAIAFAVFSWFASMPSLYTNVMRTREGGNTSRNKMIGLISCGVAIFCACISVISFGAGCQHYIDNDTSGINWSYGPAFGLMMTFIFFKLIDVIVNALVPLNEGGGGGGGDGGFTSAVPDNKA